MGLELTYWGVRGSLPASPPPLARVSEVEHLIQGFLAAGHSSPTEIRSYLDSLPTPRVGGYGTATTCVQVQSGDDLIIIDGGSGIRNLSEQLLTKSDCPKVIHIYMTHFHWDHVIGIPFFSQLFSPDYEVRFYAVHEDLEQRIRDVFRKPFFPVPFEALGSTIVFQQLEPRKPMKLGSMTITPYRLDHPDPCWGLKVEAGGKAYSHCVDTECTRTTRDELGPDLPLYQNTNVMYFDAQYTLPELIEKANWGHSAAQIGIEIALREGIPKVLFAHHDPNANFEYVERLEEQTRSYYEWRVQSAAKSKIKLTQLDWSFAYEGLKISV